MDAHIVLVPAILFQINMRIAYVKKKNEMIELMSSFAHWGIRQRRLRRKQNCWHHYNVAFSCSCLQHCIFRPERTFQSVQVCSVNILWIYLQNVEYMIYYHIDTYNTSMAFSLRCKSRWDSCRFLSIFHFYVKKQLKVALQMTFIHLKVLDVEVSVTWFNQYLCN